MKFKYLKKLENLMLWVNVIAIFSIGIQFLFISQYIVKYTLSYQLLNNLNRVPQSPEIIFWQCASCAVILVALVNIRRQFSLKMFAIKISLTLEIIMSVITFFAVKMNYSGIFLLTVVDLFLSSNDLPFIVHYNHYHFWIGVSLILVLIFSLSNYSFLGTKFDMPSLETYIDFLPLKMAYIITLINNFLPSANLILFISIAFGYSSFLANREHKIKSQLSVMSKTNQKLKAYAAVSEKIAQDRERKRIARDLHDTVGHALTGIAAGIDAVIVLIDLDPKSAKMQLNKVSVAVRQGLKDIRKTLNQLRPDALKNYTLEASIKKMLTEFSDISHLNITFLYNWGQINFEKTTEIVVFRAIEESVTNALLHGHASKITVNCKINKEYYEILISNNGATAKNIIPGYGLTQMKERVAIINGKIKIKTEPIFTVKIDIPRKD